MDSTNTLPSNWGYTIAGPTAALAADITAQAFLKRVKPLISFYRILGLTPMGVYTCSDGEQMIRKSRFAQFYSSVVMVILWMVLMMKCIKTYGEPHKGHFGIYYACARIFFYLSISFT